MRRLWVSSMTRAAIGEGFEHLRDGEEMQNLEAAARSRSEADWLVGMNATRAATVRGRALGGVVSLGRVQTPTLALIVAPRPRDRRVRARDVLPGRRPVRRSTAPRTYTGRWFEGKDDRTAERERAEAVAAAAARRRRDGRVGQAHRAQDPAAAAVRPDEPAARRQQPLRALGLAHAAGGPAPVRGVVGRRASSPTRARARSSCPPTRSAALKGIARGLTGDPAGAAAAAEYVAGLDVLPLARVVNDAKVDDHHAIIPTGELPTQGARRATTRASSTSSCAASWPCSTPRRSSRTPRSSPPAAEHRFRTRGRRLVEAGWRGAAFGEEAAAEEPPQGDEDEPRQVLPRVDEGERGTCEQAEVLEKQTKPPAALLRGVAPARHGDGRQADRGRGAAPGDEGRGPGHARPPARRRSRSCCASATSSGWAGRCARPPRAARRSACCTTTRSPRPS